MFQHSNICEYLLTKKGGDTTFGTFPDHITALVQHALPKVDVRFLVYPAFETKGALEECVSQFRDWYDALLGQLVAED
jgi:hypothetical protein